MNLLLWMFVLEKEEKDEGAPWGRGWKEVPGRSGRSAESGWRKGSLWSPQTPSSPDSHEKVRYVGNDKKKQMKEEKK